jgi:hypothetical protein
MGSGRFRPPSRTGDLLLGAGSIVLRLFWGVEGVGIATVGEDLRGSKREVGLDGAAGRPGLGVVVFGDLEAGASTRCGVTAVSLPFLVGLANIRFGEVGVTVLGLSVRSLRVVACRSVTRAGMLRSVVE